MLDRVCGTVGSRPPLQMFLDVTDEDPHIRPVRNKYERK